MFKELPANCKNDNTLKWDYQYPLHDEGTLESMIRTPLDKSIEYMFDKLMRALPNDTARLFFLQSELLNKEFKKYQTDETIWIGHNDYKHKYYIEVKIKLNQLKEQCEQIRL